MVKSKNKIKELIELDCTDENNLDVLNRELLTIPVIKKHTIGDRVQSEVLERVILLISQKSKNNLRPSAIAADVWTNKKSIVWKTVVACDDKKNIYVGTIYGKTLWEVLAKCVILMYAKLKG